MGDSPLGAALNPSVNPNISNVMTCQVNIARDHRSHPSRFSFLEQKHFLCFEKDLRFQEKIAETVGVNWEGLAAIIIFYLAVLMVKNLAMLMEKKKQLLYHHLLILAYVQSVTVQAFLGCANVPIIFNYRHIGAIGT